MNHHTVEFLARDRIADLRREAAHPGIERPDKVTSPPTRRDWSLAIRRLVTRFHVGWHPSPRHG